MTVYIKGYLAGPMRGREGFNYQAFMDAEELLRQQGLWVVNPARHDLETWPTLPEDHPEAWASGSILPEMEEWVHQQFRWDVDQLLQVGYVILLPGWEQSVGAQVEAVLAKLMGTPISELTEDGDLVPADHKVEETIRKLRS